MGARARPPCPRSRRLLAYSAIRAGLLRRPCARRRRRSSLCCLSSSSRSATRCVQGTHGEQPAVGVAARPSFPFDAPSEIRDHRAHPWGGHGGCAHRNPFADALFAKGASPGIDPYLLFESVVPAATEAPEFVVVAVLVANQRPAQGMALFLAFSVSQWILARGALPVAYLAGGGGVAMPLAARE